jgi:hypothetical protein
MTRRGDGTVLDPMAGTGSMARGLDQLVRLFLIRQGWQADPPGPAGALWRRGDNQVVAVPDHIGLDSSEWRSVVQRLSAFEARQPEDIASTIQLQMTDVTRLRAANDVVIAGSIPLPAGVNLVSSAYAMLRAAATASVRPRAHIAGNFSKRADEVAAQARLGHTESGSYIIPLLMPLTSPADDRADAPPVPGMEIERSPIEPAERRVTRTLAQALDAVDRLIVQPARNPLASDLTSAVVAGVTRELVAAVSRVIADPSVAELDASFAWSSAVGDPGGVPSTVRIPSDAIEVLDLAAQQLRSSSFTPHELITGPIVEVRHEPGDPFGEISVQTMRRGRIAEVRVRLTEEQLVPTFVWARDGRSILVEGRVRRAPGQPLRIDALRQIHPLDESYLPSDGGA